MQPIRALATSGCLAFVALALAAPGRAEGAPGFVPGCVALSESSLPVSADAAEHWVERAIRRCALPTSADAAEHWLRRVTVAPW
jgi:hypothetical protein